jgi:hypothetical protein
LKVWAAKWVADFVAWDKALNNVFPRLGVEKSDTLKHAFAGLDIRLRLGRRAGLPLALELSLIGALNRRDLIVPFPRFGFGRLVGER